MLITVNCNIHKHNKHKRCTNIPTSKTKPAIDPLIVHAVQQNDRLRLWRLNDKAKNEIVRIVFSKSTFQLTFVIRVQSYCKLKRKVFDLFVQFSPSFGFATVYQKWKKVNNWQKQCRPIVTCSWDICVENVKCH